MTVDTLAYGIGGVVFTRVVKRVREESFKTYKDSDDFRVKR